MLRSLYSGVAGLTSHQTKMDVIGNNIANVNTYGFKSSRVCFRDIYYQTTKTATGGTATTGGVNPSQIGYGVTVSSVDKNMSRSSFQSTSSTLDVAIAGEGFFQVQDKAGNKFYTRAGMLNVDNQGNLVDTNGKFILGVQNSDPTVAEGLATNPSNNKIQIKVPDVYKAKSIVNMDESKTGVTGFTAKITYGFLNGNQTTPIKVSIKEQTNKADGDTVDEYKPDTTPATLVISLVDTTKITNLEDLQNRINTAIENERTREPENTNPTTPTNRKGPNLITKDNFKGGNITCALDGGTWTKADGTALTAKEIALVKANSVKAIVGQDIAQMDPYSAKQSFSDLSSFYIGDNGNIIGIHAVHGTLTFGRIDLATFDNPTGLGEAGNSYYTVTTASGDAKLASPGFSGSGELVTTALEMSNVNLAQEFSDMIITQRGFQANSRIITTSDSLLEELVNLKR